MARAFDRTEALAELRPHLTRYISPGGLLETETAMLAGLTGLTRDDLDQLSAVHLLLDPLTTQVATTLPQLVRQLPSSSTLTSQELQGAVRGQVRWADTMQRRWHSGNPTVFVCAMPERRYDTAQGRLLKATTLGLNDAVRRTGWRRELDRPATTNATPRDRAIDSVRHVDTNIATLAAHPKLRDVRSVSVRQDMLSVLQTRASLTSTCQVYERYRQLLVDHDAAALLNALAARFLAPDQDRLFELLTAFRLADSFADQGWKRNPTRRLLGSRAPVAELQRGDTTLRLWWQHSVFKTAAAAQAGVTSGNLDAVRGDTGARVSAYRPDLLVEFERDDGARRLAIGEVKLTQRDAANPEADGIRDAFAYLHDAQPLAALLPISAFVVAWDAQGRPTRGRLLVSDQAHLADLATGLANAPFDVAATH